MKYKRKKFLSASKTGYIRVGPVKAGLFGVGCLIPLVSFLLGVVLLGLVIL